MADETKAAADAATGANAVAKAVTDVAAAASAAASAAAGSAAAQGLTLVGSPGGPFTIRGTGFGAGGTLFVNGQQVQTTAWGDFVIKGQLPADVKSGEVVIKVAPDKELKGVFKGGVK